MSIKDRKINVAYQLPKLCANCGVKPPETSWRIRQKFVIDTKREISFTRKSGIKKTHTYRVLDFSVGVCKECEGKLKRGRSLTKLISFGLSPLVAFGIIGLLLADRGSVPSNIPKSIFIVVIVGAIIISATATFLFWVPPLGQRSFDGTKFTFRNKAYEAAFAKLNPKLVYRDHP